MATAFPLVTYHINPILSLCLVLKSDLIEYICNKSEVIAWVDKHKAANEEAN